MKTKTINLYEFDELSKEAQNKAVHNLSDINVDFEWWNSTYEDAKNVGLIINSFDLDRNRHAKGEFYDSAMVTAIQIVAEHGPDCETYKTAQSFINEWEKAVKDHSDGVNVEQVIEEKESDFDKIADNLEDEFLKSILEDYSIMLQKEYEYLASE